MQPSSRHSLGSSRRYSCKDRRPSQIRKVADKDGWAMHRHYRAEMSCPGYSRRSQTCTTCSQKHVERKAITLLWYVRFGKANKTSCRRDVRFTPESGHLHCTTACPLWANSGHRRPGCDGILSLLQGKPSSKCDENCTGGCLNCASDMRSIEPLSEATEKQNHC